MQVESVTYKDITSTEEFWLSSDIERALYNYFKRLYIIYDTCIMEMSELPYDEDLPKSKEIRKKVNEIATLIDSVLPKKITFY
jgi:hypothetical protein